MSKHTKANENIPKSIFNILYSISQDGNRVKTHQSTLRLEILRMFYLKTFGVKKKQASGNEFSKALMFESAYGRDFNLKRTDVQCSCLMLPFQFNIAPSRPWQINLLVLSETFDYDPELSDSELAIKTCSAFNEDLQPQSV